MTAQRHTEQEPSGRGSGHRHPAVFAVDRAAAGRNATARDAIDFQQVEPDGGADEIGNRVQCADFVEMDFSIGTS